MPAVAVVDSRRYPDCSCWWARSGRTEAQTVPFLIAPGESAFIIPVRYRHRYCFSVLLNTKTRLSFALGRVQVWWPPVCEHGKVGACAATIVHATKHTTSGKYCWDWQNVFSSPAALALAFMRRRIQAPSGQVFATAGVISRSRCWAPQRIACFQPHLVPPMLAASSLVVSSPALPSLKLQAEQS